MGARRYLWGTMGVFITPAASRFNSIQSKGNKTMSTVYDPMVKLSGEQAIARAALRVVPLIVEHFKSFDGERAIIANGARSAKFQKVTDRFGDAVRALKIDTLRCYVDSSIYSVSVKMDVTEPDPGREVVNYFNDYIYIGELKDRETFSYTFDQKAISEAYAYRNRIVAVTPAELTQALAEYKALLKQAAAVQESMPYCLKALFDAQRHYL